MCGRNSGECHSYHRTSVLPFCCENTPGKVVFEDPIHHISGKIAKKFRTIYNYAKATGLKYTSVHGERSTQPSTKELKARERFTAVAEMVRARKIDLSKIVTDQENFLAQKDTATGAKTMRAYLWRVCGQEYDQQHNG